MLTTYMKKYFSTNFNLARLKTLRLELHNSPEVGFQEHNTNKILSKYLIETLGISSEQFQRVGGETGFIVTIKGKGQKQKLKGPKTLMFRTDIDALHIGGGKAKHLCGHDGHMTSIIAFAELLLSEGTLTKIPSNCAIKLLFQPAEEATKRNGVYQGGALKVVQEGGMNGVDEIYGYHNWPCRPFGKCLIQPGNFLPSVSIIDFQIIGKGGHGSAPERCLDPSNYKNQQIVSKVEPLTDILVKQRELKRKFAMENPNFRWSLGIVQAGTAHNIIPDTAVLEGSIRVFDQPLSERIKKAFDTAALQICEQYKCKLKGEVLPLYPTVFNHDLQTEVMKTAARNVLGNNNVGEETELNVIGEDFAFYLQKVPGAFGLMSSGTGVPGFTHLHQSQFKFNDDLIETVSKIYMNIVKQRLIEDC